MADEEIRKLRALVRLIDTESKMIEHALQDPNPTDENCASLSLSAQGLVKAAEEVQTLVAAVIERQTKERHPISGSYIGENG